MAGSINEFLSKTRGDFAVANLFHVSIIPPTALVNSLLNQGLVREADARSLNFLCNSAPIPGLTMATTDKAQDYRERIKQKLYDDVTLRFYCTDTLTELNFFNSWMDLALNPRTNRIGYHGDYASTVIIDKLSKTADLTGNNSTRTLREVTKTLSEHENQRFAKSIVPQMEGFNKKAFTVTLLEAFPKRTEPLQLDYGTGEILNVNVTMSYRYHQYQSFS